MRRMTLRMMIVAALVVMFFCNGSLILAQDMKTAAPGVAYLENVTFEKINGKERVSFIVSQPTTFKVEDRPTKSVLINLENAFVPDELRRPIIASNLSNVTQAFPAQKSIEGQQWVVVTIDLLERAPFSIRQEGQKIIVDFNVASLAARTVAPEEKVAARDVGPKSTETPMVGRTTAVYTGKRISLDFQEASIKAVFRLLAEVSGMSIVSGEDVKGNVTVHMENVPWDQALDTILTVNSLSKRVQGDIITVMTAERTKKDEEELRKIVEERKKAEQIAKDDEVKQRAEQGKLRQISIEAKIIEATDSFIRNLGIQWGGGIQGIAGSNYPYGVLGGTRPGLVSPLTDPTKFPGGIGLTAESLAVNFLPATLSTPTIGFVMGSANAILAAQINALETTTEGKIISSPKITTMDNVKATIKQGQDIPFITPATATNPQTVSFKEAVLKLDVKPKITTDGKISMEISANNDFADYAMAATLSGNPPINKSSIESQVVVADGDTIVIGGVLRTEDAKTVSGLPWLSKIPLLGWLFKTENITKSKRQLLIFVTPRIIQDSKTS